MDGFGQYLLPFKGQCGLVQWCAPASCQRTTSQSPLLSAGDQQGVWSKIIKLLYGVALQGIYDTLKECAAISKSAGGIGLSIHNIRAKGSYIRGTNGNSNGIVPMLRVFNDTARYVDQVGDWLRG